MQKSPKDVLWGWTVHGVSPQGKWTSNEQEFYTECPFCTNNDGFYINPFKGKLKAGVFQCKACSKQGSYLTFLKEIHEIHKGAIQDYHYEALATDRNLPIEALRGYGLGWSGEYFTLPVRNVNKEFIGLQFYKPGQALMNSPNTTTGLFCASRLVKHIPGKPIIICEGAWDGMAMTWLLKEMDKKGTVVAVPGSNISLAPWEVYLLDQDVILLYDKDKAGVAGEFKAYQILINKAKSLSFIHWPEKKPEGYDIRDHIVKWGIDNANPKKAYRLIEAWLKDVPRHLSNMAAIDKHGKLALERRKEKLDPISFKDLIISYQDYLYMPDIDPIKILLGTVYANRFLSNMVWMFLVAPPSNGKSELIMSLEGSPEIELVSTITEHTFVSGFIGAGGTDVSLFDKLRNRVMAVKDFTPILQTVPQKQQQIFGTLRDAYDGRTDSFYGHGTNRRYKDLHFGIIAGVTSEIERFGQVQQSLGERFLRYYFKIRPDNEQHILKKSESNLLHEKKKRDILKHNVYRFLETNKGNELPQWPDKIREQMRHIARFTAALRAVVPRDFKDRVQYHPSKEGPFRLNTQFNLLAMGMACLEQKKEIGLEEIRIIKDVALSTCPDITKTLIQTLYNAKGLPMSQKNLEDETKFPIGTIKYILDDLKMLDLVNKAGVGFKIFYTLTPKCKELISSSRIYEGA